MKKIRKAVIPAAGYGTRLLPITKSVPKELLPIGNKPAIQYVVEEAVASGVEEIILVCNPGKMAVAEYFQPDPILKSFLERKGKKKEIEELERIESLAKFTIVFQKEPLGLGHAVWCAKEAVEDERFLVMLPDVLVMPQKSGAPALVEACFDEETKWGLLLEQVPKEKISAYGIIKGEKVAEGKYLIEGAVEKPKPEEAPSDLSLLGRYLFIPQIFELIQKVQREDYREIQLTDAIHGLAQVKKAEGVVCREKIFDIGTSEGLYSSLCSLNQ